MPTYCCSGFRRATQVFATISRQATTTHQAGYSVILLQSPFFVFFCLFSCFFTKIWENADFLTKSGKDYLRDLTFRDFGVNEQNDFSIAKLDIISSNNIDFS